MLLVMVFSACSETGMTDYETILEEYPEDTDIYHDANYTGIVLDEKNNVLSNVEISALNLTQLSNSQGIYLLRNIKSNAQGSILKFYKKGYFNGYQFNISAPSDIMSNQITMQLLRNSISFQTSEPKAININDDMEINLAANNYIYQNGMAYSGIVKFHYLLDESLKNIPILDYKYFLNIVSDSKAYNMLLTDEMGNELNISKPVQIISRKIDADLSALNANKQKFVSVVESENGYMISKITPVIIGKNEIASRINGKILIGDNPFNNHSVSIVFENEIHKATVSNTGNFSAYVPRNKSVNIALIDKCYDQINLLGNILAVNSTLKIPDINISREYFNIVESNLTTCMNNIEDDDLICLILESNNVKKVFYQTSNQANIFINECESLKNVKYMSGNNLKLNLHDPPLIESKYNLSNHEICLPKIKGFLTIGNKTIHYNSDQINISREGSTDDLAITDFNNLYISVPDVIAKGNYKPSSIIINHPEVYDCLSNCISIDIKIEDIKNIGDPVIIEISGKIKDKDVRGHFEQILKK